MNLPPNGDLWKHLRDGCQVVFSPTACRSKHLEALISRMMHPKPEARPSIEEVLMHPCIQATSNSFLIPPQTPPETQQRKATIIISPSTVAKELRSRKNELPFALADTVPQDSPH